MKDGGLSLDRSSTGKSYKTCKLLISEQNNSGNFFLMKQPISPIGKVSVTHIPEAFMAKTLALFFVLGLMVSCTSYHNERGISSVDQWEKEEGYRHDRGSTTRDYAR